MSNWGRFTASAIVVKKKLGWLHFTGAILFLNSTLFAAAQESPFQSAKERHTQYCASCHGVDGNSSQSGIPSLAAQPVVFLETQLVYIREGLREVPSMREVSKTLSDAEITRLSQWYANQPVRPRAGPINTLSFERGQALAKKALCGTCHMPNYQGQQQVPRLTGQREDYLQTTLRLMRDGKAIGRDTIMTSALEGLDNQALDDLAHYFAKRNKAH